MSISAKDFLGSMDIGETSIYMLQQGRTFTSQSTAALWRNAYKMKAEEDKSFTITKGIVVYDENTIPLLVAIVTRNK